MDNLTHTLTGVLLSRAGFNRRAPRATLALVLAVNAPDIDIVSRWQGSLAYLHYHRGATHSLLAAPVLAALVTGLVWLLSRGKKEKFRWGWAYLASLTGVTSHVLMDFMNTYGIRPFWPWSGQWYSCDIEFIVDPWVLAALLACLAGPAFGRMISGEIGAQAGRGSAAAVLGLALVAGGWGARELLHRRAVAMLEARLYGFNPAASSDGEAAARSMEGLPPLRTAAFATALNPFLWRGFVETEGFYEMVDVDVRLPLDPTAGRIYYKPERMPALAAALETRTAREFSAFARYRYASVERVEDGYRVILTDFRFRRERPSGFTCTIDLDENLRVAREAFRF
ncbi:MAG TPA: metal-dependent hydrolase [Bryobacterales bacterium]|nr:metal-dependent hydrolase [Bryobacterales bacterium]